MAWTVETLGDMVDAEIAALPKDMQAAFLRLAERIEAVGLERIGPPTSSTSRTSSGRCGLADETGLLGRSTSPRPGAASSWSMSS